mmetsp:Transcript_6406/g.9309  ORF Transcript_6406/g.9309 Transcript_6406/m.9309 type:complete len:310 (+) Transcript_6406:100-1029(+)
MESSNKASSRQSNFNTGTRTESPESIEIESIGFETSGSINSDEVDDWQFVNSTESNDSMEATNYHDNEDNPSKNTKGRNLKILSRCTSTPELSHLDDDYSHLDDETFIDCDSSFDVQSHVTNDTEVVMVNRLHSEEKKEESKTTSSPSLPKKKFPSFKDAILLNAKEVQNEQDRMLNRRQKIKEKLQKEHLQRRKSNKPKLVVSPIKRCARSTGDLTKLMIIQEGDDNHQDSGAVGGATNASSFLQNSIPIQEEEVMGETDAEEFYSYKAMGSVSRKKSLKIRPDEAKRKQFIMHKKGSQRRRQIGMVG